MTKNNLINKDERLEDLLCGGLSIIQNPNEYLFTSDAVALANFAKCKKGGVLVDLCSGSGVIGLLMYAKNIPSMVHMVELQSHMADMSARSVQYNNLQDKIIVHNMPLQNCHATLGCNMADVVVCNPPYKSENNLHGAKPTINVAKHEIEVTLEEVIRESAKLLKFGGKLYIVNKIERLTDMIVYMRKYAIEPKIIKFLDKSVMIQGTLGGKNGLKLEK